MIAFVLAAASLPALSKLPPSVLQTTPTAHVGVRTVTYQDAVRKRPVLVEIWYPTQKKGPIDLPQDIWIHPPEIRNAPLSEHRATYPLILMSHGHGGDRRDRSWLVESLVKNGYIVVSIEHHGNSWRTYDPLLSLRFWERARDVSFVLSEILKDPLFNGHVDIDQIGFIGYSMGGLTGLSLAGAKAENVKQVIQNHQDRFKEIDPAIVENIDFSEAEKDFADPRIKAILLLSPATFVYTPETLKQVKTPVALVATEHDEVLPHQDHAHQIITHLSPTKVKLLHDKISHYAFLNRVTEMGKKQIEPDIATDSIQSSRPQLHKDVSQFTVEFFGDVLKN